MPYRGPDFEQIIQRIKRIGFPKAKKSLTINAFNDLTTYDKFCLIHKCFGLLSIATFSDIVYILKGLFKGKISIDVVKKIISILVGSEYLQPTGGYWHDRPNPEQRTLNIRGGSANDQTTVLLELASIYSSGNEGSLQILEESRRVT